MRRLPHIEQAVFGEPWAITPQMFSTVCDVVETAILEAAAKPNEFKAEMPKLRMMEGIPVIQVMGVISRRMNMFSAISGGTSIDVLDAQFTEALATDSETVIMLFDTPGGAVPGVPEFATRIYEAAKSEKRIVGLAEGTCCSAGYWMMSQCNEVYCTEASAVGSIGVVAAVTDTSRAERNQGMETVVLRSSPLKAPGVGPVTGEQISHLQERVETVAGMFRDAVSRTRTMDMETVDPASVWIGAQAVRMGLCDGITTLQDLLKRYAM